MHQGSVVDLDAAIALDAAHLSVANKLPLADSIILATARHHDATLWTLDADFEGLPGVRYFAKR
jgi:predicted nucleic acid-binding protein